MCSTKKDIVQFAANISYIIRKQKIDIIAYYKLHIIVIYASKVFQNIQFYFIRF